MSSNSIQDSKKVFVVHGRNGRLRLAMFRFLRSIGVDSIEWLQAVQLTGKTAPFVGEVLDTAFGQAQAIVVLFTGDDGARLMEQFRDKHDPEFEAELTPQARPNVLFEAGMAMGRCQERTILVQVGNLRPFSDIAGRHTVRLDGSPERCKDLADRLKSAGCTVDVTGADWLSECTFEIENRVAQPAEPVQSSQHKLPSKALEVLRFIASDLGSNSSAYGVSLKLRASQQETLFYLEELLERQLMEADSEQLETARWHITKRGRNLLFNQASAESTR